MVPNYKKSIVNITATINEHFGNNTNHPSLPILKEELTKEYKHIVLVLMDGFGVNLLKAHLPNTALLNNAFKTTLTSVFPPTTTAATTAVLTGLTPYESGFLGWFQFFKDYDTYFTVFIEEDYYDSKKAIHPDLKTFFNRESFIDQITKLRPEITGKIFFPYPIDKAGYTSVEHGIKAYLDFTKKHDLTLSYFYIVEPDLTEHKTGIYSQETKVKAIELNNIMERLQALASQDTLVIVTADHGLTDVVPIDLFSDTELVETFEHNPSIEPRATTFFIKENQTKTFETLFNKKYGDFFTLYKKDDFLKTGLLGHGKKHPFVDTCLGNYISIATDVYFFELSQDKKHIAHHAGLKDDEMLVPLIFFKGGM
ncbi:MAG: alkaline phosphatase family protein [Candidatus Izemoplasmataceae bacterium]